MVKASESFHTDSETLNVYGLLLARLRIQLTDYLGRVCRKTLQDGSNRNFTGGGVDDTSD